MKTSTLPSGLIVPEIPEPPPPEHPARAVIRKHLAAMAEDLNQFEQTTHGAMRGGGIAWVADAIERAYDDPRAFTISDLKQKIDNLTEAVKA